MSAIAPHAWAVYLLGSVLLGAGAWGAGLGVQRVLRISPAAPCFWSGVWVIAALPPLVAVVLAMTAPAQVQLLPMTLALPIALGGDELPAGAGATAPVGVAWPSLSAVLAWAWGAGFALALLRLLKGMSLAYRIQRQSHPFARDGWPGPLSRNEADRLHCQGIALRATDHAVTPFALRWPRRTIVLPMHVLHPFNDRQLRLVLRHEAEHLQRRDPQRAGVMAVVGALMWFNPFLRLIAARVQLTAELRCDALALADDRSAGREFASAYLTALRLSGQGAPSPALNALTHRDMAGHQLRIQHMLRGGGSPPASWPARLVLVTLGAAAAAGAAVVQAAALAPAPVPSPPVVSVPLRLTQPVAAPVPADVPLQFDAPLERLRITGHFGDTGGPRQSTHRGTDFAARVGTLVHAPADATVAAATDHYPGGPQYGTVVVLDHGNGWQTLYAHLDSTDLKVGQRVQRGDPIARSGRSGRVTGPHLHMEMLFNGERLDPLTRLQ